MKVRDFDDFLYGLDPTARGERSPDGLVWGDMEMEVRAVATTWLATMEVLARAAEAGVNLVITHEPTFWYHGTPQAPELTRCEQAGVDVSLKTEYLLEHGLSVIRAHNCWDRYPEYGIEDSLRAVLAMPDPIEYIGGFHSLYEVPQTTLGELARHCKEQMGLPSVRVSGKLEKRVTRLVLAYGASGGTERYYRIWRKGADAIISGEQCEWEDICPALDMGLGVIELGHANTEAFGMEGLARLLQEHFPEIPVKCLPTGDPFHYV